MTGWHLVKTEWGNGGRSVILPWHYLEQQETHTPEKRSQQEMENSSKLAFHPITGPCCHNMLASPVTLEDLGQVL